jgi:hypothetical protein
MPAGGNKRKKPTKASALRAKKTKTLRGQSSKALSPSAEKHQKQVEAAQAIKDPEAVLAALQELQATVGDLTKRRRHEPCSDTDFRAIVDHLKTVCPPPKRCSVTVTRVPTSEIDSGAHADTDKVRDKFTITIDKSLTYYETEQFMIHEWAHVLAWRPYHPLSGDHGPDWGVWYSIVYRKYFGTE